MRRRALQRLVGVGAGVVQQPQPQDRQPAEAEPGRQRDRRAGRHGRACQGLPGGQGPVRHGRGHRDRGAQDREHQDDRDRDLRAPGRDRPDLCRQPLLSRARRQGRRGGVRRHPRGHDQEEDGRHRPHRAGQARAHADAAAARQGHARHHLALPLRGAAGRRDLRRDRRQKLPAEMLDIAQEIINRMSGHFEPDTFTDRYEEAVVAMLRAKQQGQISRWPSPRRRPTSSTSWTR